VRRAWNQEFPEGDDPSRVQSKPGLCWRGAVCVCVRANHAYGSRSGIPRRSMPTLLVKDGASRDRAPWRLAVPGSDARCAGACGALKTRPFEAELTLVCLSQMHSGVLEVERLPENGMADMRAMHRPQPAISVAPRPSVLRKERSIGRMENAHNQPWTVAAHIGHHQILQLPRQLASPHHPVSGPTRPAGRRTYSPPRIFASRTVKESRARTMATVGRSRV